MQARLAVLGATGSIGRQALEVARAHSDRLRLVALSCRSRTADCEGLAGPGARVVVAERDGEAAIVDLARASDVDLVVIGIPGIAALRPTLAALEAGKAVAIATKEVLVVGGHLVRGLVPEGAGVRLRPIDSEHCALWQCLRGEDIADVASVTLTASGGPFREVPLGELRRVTIADALHHPTWRMGPKVTIDSATLANKGFEVVEAHWLFGLPYEKVRAALHPQSLVHALVSFVDGGVKAQLAEPDMRLPIQYALLSGERLPSAAPAFELPRALEFAAIDAARYPCFGLVLEAARRGPASLIAVNAADEVAVERFLHGEIPFTGIAELLERALAIAAGASLRDPDVDEVIAFDAEVRRRLAAVPVA